MQQCVCSCAYLYVDGLVDACVLLVLNNSIMTENTACLKLDLKCNVYVCCVHVGVCKFDCLFAVAPLCNGWVCSTCLCVYIEHPLFLAINFDASLFVSRFECSCLIACFNMLDTHEMKHCYVCIQILCQRYHRIMRNEAYC